MAPSPSLGNSSAAVSDLRRMPIFVFPRLLLLCTFVAAPWIFRTTEAAGPGAAKVAELPTATVSSALHQAIVESFWEAKKANMLVAPLSVWRVVRLMEDGASGRTLREMVSLLNLNGADLDVGDVSSSPHVPDTGVTVDAAERIYRSPVQDQILEHYCSVEEARFNTGYEIVDFAESDRVAEEVNNFVRSVTRNTLRYAVSSMAFFPDTRLALISGLFLDAPWGLPFQPSDGSEHASGLWGGSRDQNCQYMERVISKFETEYLDEGPILSMRLPFMHRDLAMYIFMPDDLEAFEADPGFPQVIDNLVDQMHQEIYERWQHRKEHTGSIRLVLPRFVIGPHDNSYDISLALKAMGVNDLFEEADLSPMTEAAGFRVDVFRHPPGISVNEKGAVAAASSSAVVSERHFEGWGLISRVGVNRPFVFQIRYQRGYETTGPGPAKTDLVLFSGHVTNCELRGSATEDSKRGSPFGELFVD